MGGHEPLYEKAAVQEGKAAARRRWKKGVVEKARQKRWQELTAYSAVVLHTWPPAMQTWPPCGGDEGRPTVGSGLEADSG